MVGIYKITNNVNKKVYIGQSVQIQARWKQHVYEALRGHSNMVIHQAMRKYGVKNFNFEIVETCEKFDLDERERYWIQYYDSYNNGYNSTVGGMSLSGSEHPRALVTEEDVWSIRELYNQHVPQREAWEIYKNCGLTKRGFQKIWKHETWLEIHQDVYTPENKQWHKQFAAGQTNNTAIQDRLKQEEIDNIVKDHKAGMEIKDLVKKYHHDYGIIEKYLSHPVEQKNVPTRGRQIQNVETGLIFKSISAAARWAHCGATTITRHLYDNKPAGVVPETNVKAHWKEI